MALANLVSGPPDEGLILHLRDGLRGIAPATDAGRTPRQSAVAALRSVRTLLHHLSDAPQLTPDARGMMAALDVSLKNIEAELLDLECYKPPGPITSSNGRRRSEKDRALEQQARTVVAVKWLQILEENPLRPGEAMKLAARVMCGSESEINAWLGYFERHNTPRRHDALNRYWRELKAAHKEADRRMEDASRDDVLQWLQGGGLPVSR